MLKMFLRLQLSFSVGCILVLLFLCNGCNGKRRWEYEPLSVESTSTDTNKMNVNVRIERVGRGEFAFTGTFDCNYDMDETTMIEAVGYRSSSGSEEDYQVLPWSIPKQTYKEFTETHYKDMVYKNFEKCSNLPHPDNSYPWLQQSYKLDKCVASGDGMPEIAPEGYYKIYFNATGEVDWGLKIIVKITTSKDMMG